MKKPKYDNIPPDIIIAFAEKRPGSEERLLEHYERYLNKLATVQCTQSMSSYVDTELKQILSITLINSARRFVESYIDIEGLKGLNNKTE